MDHSTRCGIALDISCQLTNRRTDHTAFGISEPDLAGDPHSPFDGFLDIGLIDDAAGPIIPNDPLQFHGLLPHLLPHPPLLAQRLHLKECPLPRRDPYQLAGGG